MLGVWLGARFATLRFKLDTNKLNTSMVVKVKNLDAMKDAMKG